jgi:hypothetical protein
VRTPGPAALLDRLPDWLRALRNPLTFYAATEALAVVLFYLTLSAASLPVEIRTALAFAVLFLFGAPGVLVFFLAWHPGDRWASPEERAMNIGPQYGTDARALPRAEVRRIPGVKAPPSGPVIESVATERLSAAENAKPTDAGEEDR